MFHDLVSGLVITRMTSQIGLLTGAKKGSIPAQKQAVVSPATGVKSDFEKLLTRFTETNSVRYEEFAAIWRDLKMSFIFAGRRTDSECREFLEDSFRITVQFLLPPYNFQVRVGALYILYAMYVKQPCTPLVQIRMMPSEFSELPLFLAEVQKQHHLDVEYIYHYLQYHRAYIVSATALPMSLSSREAVLEDPLISARQDMLLEQRSILSEIMEPDNIDQLSAIHEQYHRVKCMVSGGRSVPKTSLNVIKASLVQYITKAVAAHVQKRKVIIGRKNRKRHDSGQTTTSESEADSDSEAALESGKGENKQKRQSSSASTSQKQVGQRRAEIKARAFSGVGTASRSRRHRQAVTESSQTDESFSAESPLRSPVGKRQKLTPPIPLPEEEELDLSGLNVQLKQSLLSMPTFSDFTGSPKGKGKKKREKKAKAAVDKKKDVKKTKRRTKKENPETSKAVVKEEETDEHSPSLKEIKSVNEESSTTSKKSQSGKSQKGKKKMPTIVMKPEKPDKKKGKRAPRKKKSADT